VHHGRLVRRRKRARTTVRVYGVEERVVLLGASHVDADEPWLARVLHAPGRAFRRDLLRTEAERLARAGDQRIAVAGAEDPALAEDIAVIEGALAMTETRTCGVPVDVVVLAQRGDGKRVFRERHAAACREALAIA